MRTTTQSSEHKKEYKWSETAPGGAIAKVADLPAEVPMIAFCHLSWNWVWQRPQQFLSRHSQRHPLLFVETYCSDVPSAHTRAWSPDPQSRVTILEMHLPASQWPNGLFIDQERRRMMKEFLDSAEGSRFRHAILWFNDPMAVTAFAGELGERMIVYDCMDELTQFKGAPPDLAERERQLVLLADVIFCGGRGMREKRLPLNPNTHFYGTGVDCEHFSRAMVGAASSDSAGASNRRLTLGYFGVIDERIDYVLLAEIADAHPEWDIMMIGPFAKVAPHEIPRRSNLRWLGPQAYEDLPALTGLMDVCLMPFALNEATQYINPTKALEYMAAGKPVVSTALREVIGNFSGICRIARDRSEFIRMCEEELAKPSVERIVKGLELASGNTWEAIAAKMEIHIQQVLAGRTGDSRPHIPSGERESVPSERPAYV